MTGLGPPPGSLILLRLGGLRGFDEARALREYRNRSEKFPIGGQSIDVFWGLGIPLVRKAQDGTHLCPVWAVLRTPFVAIKHGIYPLCLVNVRKTRVLPLRPFLELVPVSTLTLLTLAPNARRRISRRRFHWRVIRAAAYIL